MMLNRNLSPSNTYAQLLERSFAESTQSDRQQFRLSMPSMWCEALGGNIQQCRPITDAWGAIFCATKALDHIEDDILTSGTYEPDAAMNLNGSTGMLITTFDVLNRLEQYSISYETARDIRAYFCNTMIEVCSGQHMDIVMASPSLETAWNIMQMKSGQLVGLFFRCAARLISANELLLHDSMELGILIGSMMQLGDDLADLWSRPDERSDIASTTGASIALAFAKSVLPVESYSHLLRLMEAAQKGDTIAEAWARSLILDTGAMLYIAIRKQQMAEAAFQIIMRHSIHETPLHELIRNMSPANGF